MPGQDVAKFACPACGKEYAWKPELAGRKAKCKCGEPISVPATPPGAAAPEPEPEVDFDSFDFDAAAAAAPAAAAARAAEAPRCPSCRKALPAGAVICVQCGFNLQTGQRMSTMTGGADFAAAPAAAAPAARGTPAPAGARGALPRRGEDVETGGGLKKILIPILLVAAVAGAFFGFRALRGDGDEDANVPMKGEDRMVRRLMKEDGATELKEWLAAGGNRMVLGMTREKAAGFADKMYNMGAVKVLAFGGAATADLGIELPADPAKRKELFAWQETWHSEMFEKVQVDEGQKYILLKMRL
jgi:hypothetical protein